MFEILCLSQQLSFKLWPLLSLLGAPSCVTENARNIQGEIAEPGADRGLRENSLPHPRASEVMSQFGPYLPLVSAAPGKVVLRSAFDRQVVLTAFPTAA